MSREPRATGITHSYVNHIIPQKTPVTRLERAIIGLLAVGRHLRRLAVLRWRWRLAVWWLRAILPGLTRLTRIATAWHLARLAVLARLSRLSVWLAVWRLLVAIVIVRAHLLRAWTIRTHASSVGILRCRHRRRHHRALAGPGHGLHRSVATGLLAVW